MTVFGSDGKSGRDEGISLPPTQHIDTTCGHSARIANYWLGGHDHYPVDRQVGDRVSQVMPEAADLCRQVRYFLTRAVQHLADDLGIVQFLDLGAGLPVVDNPHQIARCRSQEARTVYVDHDRLVVRTGRALVTRQPPGVVEWVEADLRDPDTILVHAAQTLHFDRPIAVLATTVLEHLTDADDPHHIVDRLMSAMSPGSALVVSHLAGAVSGGRVEQATQVWNAAARPLLTPRSPGDIDAFFAGLQVLEPGVVPVSRWRPDHGPWGAPPPIPHYGGVATVPAGRKTRARFLNERPIDA